MLDCACIQQIADGDRRVKRYRGGAYGSRILQAKEGCQMAIITIKTFSHQECVEGLSALS